MTSACDHFSTGKLVKQWLTAREAEENCFSQKIEEQYLSFVNRIHHEALKDEKHCQQYLRS